MKRLISLVLTLTLLMSVFAICAVDSSAASGGETKLYYKYIQNNVTLTNLESFYKNHTFTNNSAFSVAIKDYNGDGVKEMILFFVTGSTYGELSVYARLYRIQNGSVVLSDTTESIDCVGTGNSCCSVCAEYYNTGFKLSHEVMSLGGSSMGQNYIIYTVSGTKFVTKKHYSTYYFPRYDIYTMEEKVSGKTYSSDRAFETDCKKDGITPYAHSHYDLYEPSWSYSTIKSKSELKGNHLFSIITDVWFNTGLEYYAFIHDNTELSYRINHLSCPYPDVSSSAWYYNAVKYCYDKEFIQGFDNGNFGPMQNIQRQDFVVIIARLAGANLSSYQSQTPKFKDVKKGAYYAGAVNWATANGIIAGYNSTTFGIGDPVTREQVATILYRYKKSPSVSNADSTLKKFSDRSSISAYAKVPLAWAVNNGIIGGTSNGKIEAKNGAKRAQIAQIITNMDKNGMFK